MNASKFLITTVSALSVVGADRLDHGIGHRPELVSAHGFRKRCAQHFRNDLAANPCPELALDHFCGSFARAESVDSRIARNALQSTPDLFRNLLLGDFDPQAPFQSTGLLE